MSEDGDKYELDSCLAIENEFGEQDGAEIVSRLIANGSQSLYEEVRIEGRIREIVTSRIHSIIQARRPKPGEKGYNTPGAIHEGPASFVELLGLSERLRDESEGLEGIAFVKPELGNPHWDELVIARKKGRAVLVCLLEIEVERLIPLALAAEEKFRKGKGRKQ
jgi:hypothetical protein